MNNPFAVIDARLSNIENLLLDIKHTPKEKSRPPKTDEFLTVQEAAEFLRLTIPTVYGKVHRNELPVMKQGKRLYFSRQELTDWVRQGRKKTVAEIDQEVNAYLKRKG